MANLFVANQNFRTFSLSYKLQANALIYSYTPKLYDFVDLFTACLKCDGIFVSYLLQTGTSICHLRFVATCSKTFFHNLV